MTSIDIALVSLAALQVVALGGMIAAAVMIRERVQDGAQQAGPALRKALAISGMARAMADRSQRDGAALVGRVAGVAAKVGDRVATTVRLAREVKEQFPRTRASVNEVTDQGEQLARQAGEARTMAERLGRIGAAARAAAKAARSDAESPR